MENASIPPARKQPSFLERVWEARVAYLFILPLMAFFCVFVLYPVLRTAQLMFMRYEFLRPDRRSFVGLANIIEWTQDPRVLETFGVSVKFFLLYVPSSTLLALLIALALDRVARAHLATVYRTIFYLPVVLPAGIIFIVWTWIYDPTWGVMNTLIQDVFGIPWPWDRWLRGPETALLSLVLMSVWRLVGVTMILFLVGLSNISNELREAARIDGASEWQTIRFIELPLLIPTFLIILVLRLQVLGLIEEPLVMTNGGPLRSTMTYGLQAYYISFRDGNWSMGYGSTWFLILGLFSTLTAFLAWKFMRQEDLT
ncbi:MAG: sugar ABC transporter permease [Chloroflexota bacterium]|nr:sugar ABC transporter permease [Chloroflexota bacterium]